MRGFGPGARSAGRGGDGRQRETFEMVLHVFTGLFPDGE